MNALEAALRGQAQAKAAVQVVSSEVNPLVAPVESTQDATEIVANSELSEATGEGASAEPTAPVEPVAAPKPAPKPVIAVRGDDRPGMKKTEPVVMGRGGKFGDRKDGGRDGARDSNRGPREGGFAGRPDDRGPRRDSRDAPSAPWSDAPRLGDTAFRAQRDALEHAQFALRKLAAQAHGESLIQLMAAWEHRDAAQVPSAQELGSRVTPATRSAWTKALAQAPAGDANVALLRLEMASEVPTPAEHINARRALQLQLLTKRNDPPPAQTWGQDAATVLASGFDASLARRVQNVLKALLQP
jgi:hypothetical protein